MFHNPAIFIVMLLAYSIVEFVYREKLNLFYRTILIMLILAVDLFIRDVIFYQYILIPIVAFAYFAISYLQSKAKDGEDGQQFRNLFLANLTHIVAFYIIYISFRLNYYPVSTVKMYSSLRIQQWEVILLVLIANIWIAPRVIRAILADFTYRSCKISGGEVKEHITDEGAAHAGTLIGILERLLIIVTALFSAGATFNISLVGFILGTKSLARFKKFDNQEFVEYFIVGTLTSVLFALLTLWPLQRMLFG